MSHHPYHDEHKVRGGPDDAPSGETLLFILGCIILVIAVVFFSLDVTSRW